MHNFLGSHNDFLLSIKLNTRDLSVSLKEALDRLNV